MLLDPALRDLQMPAVILLVSDRNHDPGWFTSLEDHCYLIRLGPPEVWIHELIAPAAGSLKQLIAAPQKETANLKQLIAAQQKEIPDLKSRLAPIHPYPQQIEPILNRNLSQRERRFRSKSLNPPRYRPSLRRVCPLAFLFLRSCHGRSAAPFRHSCRHR